MWYANEEHPEDLREVKEMVDESVEKKEVSIWNPKINWDSLLISCTKNTILTE